jgi:hypothetical protein
MVDSDLVIPNEIGKIVNERATLWQRFEESQSQFNEIEKLASQFASSTSAQIPSELTSEKTPPAEVTAALQNFKGELARISKGQEGIKAYQAEIKRIKDQQLAIIIVVGLVITAVLCVAAFGGIAIVNEILSNISR